MPTKTFHNTILLKYFCSIKLKYSKLSTKKQFTQNKYRTVQRKTGLAWGISDGEIGYRQDGSLTNTRCKKEEYYYTDVLDIERELKTKKELNISTVTAPFQHE